MDYVEKIVTDKIKEILQNFNKKSEIITKIAKKLKDEKRTNVYMKELEEYNNRLSKVLLEIDSIYNDKLNNTLSQDDFIRIYERKNKEKYQIQKSIDNLEKLLKCNFIEEENIKKAIEEFNSNMVITREILVKLINKIEIDQNKQIYIFFRFKQE